MADSERRGNNVAITWGLFVLSLGIVLLLQATGILEWRLWGTLWKFWPVLIIALGLAIIIPRRLGWLLAAIEIVALGICVWVSAVQYVPNLSGNPMIGEQHFTYPLIGVERAGVNVDFSNGNIVVTELQNDNRQLVEITDQHEDRGRPRERVVTMEADFTSEDGTVNIDVKPVNQNLWDDWQIFWRFSFNRQVPIDMDIKCDGSEVNFALEALDIKTLYLEMNVSSGTLTLPASAINTVINLDMDVSNLEIIVPKDVAVKIKIDNNLSMVSIDQDRFLKQGDYYISPDYESAANGVELNILCDVSRLVIK